MKIRSKFKRAGFSIAKKCEVCVEAIPCGIALLNVNCHIRSSN